MYGKRYSILLGESIQLKDDFIGTTISPYIYTSGGDSGGDSGCGLVTLYKRIRVTVTTII